MLVQLASGEKLTPDELLKMLGGKLRKIEMPVKILFADELPQTSNPSTCNIGMGLLAGAENCYIYVPKEGLDIFRGHYNWGAYENRIRQY